MKYVKLKISKGEFVMIDLPEYVKTTNDYVFEARDKNKEITYSYVAIGKLSEITEDYVAELNDLIKSSGIHLYNKPYVYVPDKITDTHTNLDSIEAMSKAFDAIDNTFYNPYIFKKVQSVIN